MTPREPAGPPILEARDAGRRAEGQGSWVLRGVSLAVSAGERIHVLGPSGSGKTLLLRALCLLDPLDQGSILWHGQPVRPDRVPFFRSRVVYLHQRPCLAEGTVEENLRMPLKFRTHRDRRFDRSAVIERLGMLGRDGSFLTQSTQRLSGGEAQIVALLRVMQLDPELLLLDEPTAALDHDATGAVEQLIDRWHREQPSHRSLVIVTHDPGQTARLPGRVVRMERGQIVERQTKDTRGEGAAESSS